MTITIHGKEYKTVAERINQAHDNHALLSVDTEVLSHDPVTIKAVIKVKLVDGEEATFSGISAADPSKAIEKKSPYEVAETSAVGRALAFAGYAGSEIASYEEMDKAGATDEPPFGKGLTGDPVKDFKI